MLFTNLTGKKEGKSYKEAVVFLSPTVGEFKLTPKVQETLGVKDGDFMLTVVMPDTERVFIAKGKTGVPLLDEAGVQQKNAIGKNLYEEGTGFGAVARATAGRTPLLKFAGSAGWHTLGGTTEFTKVYTLGEPTEGGTETGETNEDGTPEIFETVFYELIFKEQKAKPKRGTAENGDADEDEDEDEGYSEETAEVEEV